MRALFKKDFVKILFLGLLFSGFVFAESFFTGIPVLANDIYSSHNITTSTNGALSITAPANFQYMSMLLFSDGSDYHIRSTTAQTGVYTHNADGSTTSIVGAKQVMHVANETFINGCVTDSVTGDVQFSNSMSYVCLGSYVAPISTLRGGLGFTYASGSTFTTCSYAQNGNINTTDTNTVRILCNGY